MIDLSSYGVPHLPSTYLLLESSLYLHPPLSEEARHTHIYTMGVSKEILKEGNGQDYPKQGDQVTIEYTGNLYDPEASDNRGTQ